MRNDEATTKKVLEKILAGSNLDYLLDQSNGEWDFDVLRHDGTVEALEVTAAVDRLQVETMAAVQNKKRGGSVITPKNCKYSWMITPAKGAHIATIRRHADDYLARIESEGVTRFHFPMRGTESVNDIVRDLQVTFGGVFDKTGDPVIMIGMPVGGGAVDAGKAVEAGELEAWKPDNRKKLGAADTKERHLAVNIDARNGLPWIALTEFDPPNAPPKLPPEITTLWLLAHTDKSDTFKVWRGSAGAKWQKFQVTIP